MADIIHLHINSKNQQFNSVTNTFQVNLPAEFVKINEGDWFLQVNNFYSIYNWYNLQEDYNDQYNIYVDGVKSQHRFSEGNPRVTDIMKILNAKHSTIFTTTYDYMKNKLFYRNIAAVEVIIEPVTCGKFMGLYDNQQYILSSEGNYGNTVVNVAGDKSLLLHIKNSDFVLANTSLDNLDEDLEGNFNASQIIVNIPLNVPPFSLIHYSSTGDILDRHRVLSIGSSIQNFSIVITNEHGKVIPNMTDFTISLSFIREDNLSDNDKTLKVLSTMAESLNDIFTMLMTFFREVRMKFF